MMTYSTIMANISTNYHNNLACWFKIYTLIIENKYLLNYNINDNNDNNNNNNTKKLITSIHIMILIY